MSDIVQKAMTEEMPYRDTVVMRHRKASMHSGNTETIVELKNDRFLMFGKWVVDTTVLRDRFLTGYQFRQFWTLKSATRYFERLIRDYAMKEED